MITSQESTLTGLLNLIAELRGREKQQEASLDETRHNIEAVQTALQLLRDRYGILATQPERKAEIEALRGQKMLPALIEIAKSNYHVVKVTEAKRMLLEAGTIGNPKTAYQRITSALVRSDRFEHIRPGEYRLVAVEPPER
jgi:hypothetical protein